MDFVTIVFGIAVLIFLFWFFNSVYVIKEWERGVVLAPRPHAAGSQRRGPAAGLFPDRQAHAHLAAHRNSRRPAARRHHARQRLRESERGLLFPRGRRESRPFASAELSVRYFAARADHAAQPGRPVRTGLRFSPSAKRLTPNCNKSLTRIPSLGVSR